MNKFKVEYNNCSCHPETCNCKDFVVIKPDGSCAQTFMHKNDAQQYADDMNELSELRSKLNGNR